MLDNDLHPSLRNRKLMISRAPTKAKSQEPAYSQARRNQLIRSCNEDALSSIISWKLLLRCL